MKLLAVLRRDFNLKRVGLALFLTTLGTVVLKPYFGPQVSFFELWYRLFIVTAVLFVIYLAMGALYDRKPNRRFTRLQWQYAGLCVGALIGPIISGLVIGRTLTQMFTVEPMLWGMLFFTAAAMVLGLASATVLVYRERAARAETEAARAETREHALERQVLEARLKLMQAQIEPHFLFNTLANVQCLVETDPPLASKTLDSLITYLRAALPHMREQGSTLKRELAMCEAYLTIQGLRMGERLHFEIAVADELKTVAFPPMILITLVENAIKHAIDPMQSGGSIRIAAQAEGQLLDVTVSDTGMGLTKSAGGVGLQNVRERLAALYGKNAKLSFEENRPRGVIARISLPIGEVQ